MYKLLLCVRYLRTKYIALACIISVMLGVATMIVVNSVMAGFANEMRDRLHNFLADIVVESKSMDGIADSQSQMQIVREAAGDYIAAMTPTVEVPGMISCTDPWSGEMFVAQVSIVGIDPAGKAQVGPLQDYLDSYNAVIEDGVVTRPALRSPDTPLGWTLTPEAIEYRRQVKELNSMQLQQRSITPTFDHLPQTNSDPGDNLQAAVEEPTFDLAGDSTTPVNIARASDAVSDASTEMTPGSAAAESPIDLPFDEHFDIPDAAISTEPLAARVYLGEGIVSFQVLNPETKKLQKVMMVNPGDDVILSTVKASQPPDVVKFTATVSDIFRSGMSEYDSSIVLMNLEELQRNRAMIVDGVDHISAIHIRLKDYQDAAQVVAKLKAAFPPFAVSIRTWEEKQSLLLSAVEVETAILNVLLFLIIAVAGFGILAIFFMIVVEKTRDIGILKSLGASSQGVMSIFLSYGLGLGIVGSLAGVMIGLFFVHYINEIEDGLSWLTGRRVFDEKIYYFHEIPTQVNPMMVFWVALGAIAIAVLASVLPARRASRLHPVRALRYE
ncbi:MAG: FtsX-like permease family protein [Planctomycetaceae bacterium]